MRGNPKRKNREILSVPRLGLDRVRGRSANLSEGTAVMNVDGKSDDFVVLATRANKTATAAAGSVERRKSPKGSISELPPMLRTLGRIQHQLEWHGNHDWCQRVSAAIVRPNGGAVCGNSSSTDLCGGRPVMAVPTAMCVGIKAVFDRTG